MLVVSQTITCLQNTELTGVCMALYCTILFASSLYEPDPVKHICPVAAVKYFVQAQKNLIFLFSDLYIVFQLYGKWILRKN